MKGWYKKTDKLRDVEKVIFCASPTRTTMALTGMVLITVSWSSGKC